ncbi:hypothetical protein [Amycolatopsis alkalitolerans]|uniref:Uncharacterized protein n=1 Tax=Amycolatopsis alkalitolerans TaxID=2547244 RepID=A0A5C4LPJ3_9PSEU|nr:hypothetical protein [Amycolatopsis alkalitolerans]TNC19083.1 hypothetical protein FG385_32985 [Amycolatopsis alkalitolerans]
MTGEEHYRHAEKLLNMAGAGDSEQAWEFQLAEPPSPLLVAAHAHAKLAETAMLADAVELLHRLADAVELLRRLLLTAQRQAEIPRTGAG